MSARTLEFAGHDGSPLAARLDLPDGTPVAWTVLAHCFTCGKDQLGAARVAAGLVRHGHAVLRFDFTGLGASGGDFAATTFTSNVDDVVRAAAFLAAQGGAPTLLVGHSLGGAAVLAAAPRIESVRAVVTIGAPAEPAHVVATFAAHVPALRERGEARVELGGRALTLGRALLEDVETYALSERVGALGAALLVMHSPQDAVVGVDQARRLFDAARHPKSFVALDGVDHLVTKPADAAWVADLVAAWSVRYR